MKIYNPFKPHLVQFTDGSYAYRKSKVFYWTLLDKDGGHWWFGKEQWQRYCYGTAEEAESALLNWHNRGKTPKYDVGTLV